jgi:hypothetical protein
MTKVFTQGTFDGFCGIYCLVHLVAVRQPRKYQQVARETFFQMLRSLEKRKYLSAKRIASTVDDEIGFPAAMIAEAFNSLGPKKRFGLRAVAFSNKKFAESRFHKNAPLAFQSGCTFVAGVDAGNHWVALEGSSAEGGYAYYDPEPHAQIRKIKKISWKEGLVLGVAEVIEKL